MEARTLLVIVMHKRTDAVTTVRPSSALYLTSNTGYGILTCKHVVIYNGIGSEVGPDIPRGARYPDLKAVFGHFSCSNVFPCADEQVGEYYNNPHN